MSNNVFGNFSSISFGNIVMPGAVQINAFPGALPPLVTPENVKKARIRMFYERVLQHVKKFVKGNPSKEAADIQNTVVVCFESVLASDNCFDDYLLSIDGDVNVELRKAASKRVADSICSGVDPEEAMYQELLHVGKLASETSIHKLDCLQASVTITPTCGGGAPIDNSVASDRLTANTIQQPPAAPRAPTGPPSARTPQQLVNSVIIPDSLKGVACVEVGPRDGEFDVTFSCGRRYALFSAEHNIIATGLSSEYGQKHVNGVCMISGATLIGQRFSAIEPIMNLLEYIDKRLKCT